MTAVADEIQIDDAPFRGAVVRPGDSDYDIHRKIWNGSFDKHPAVMFAAQDPGAARRPWSARFLRIAAAITAEVAGPGVRASAFADHDGLLDEPVPGAAVRFRDV